MSRSEQPPLHRLPDDLSEAAGQGGLAGSVNGLPDDGVLSKWRNHVEAGMAAEVPPAYCHPSWTESPFRSFVEPWLVAALMAARFPSWCPSGVIRSQLSFLASTLLRVSGPCVEIAYRDFGAGFGWEAYVSRSRSNGFAEIWKMFPVLRPVLANFCEQWHTHAPEVLFYLEKDQPELLDRFGHGVNFATLVGVESAGSDRHHDGRMVWILSFKGGERLVFKPRSTAIEGAWSRFLGWWRNQCPELAPPGLSVLDTGSHGWVVFEHEGKDYDDPGMRAYHRKLGGLLFLAHLFGTVDLHSENLIASPNGPLLVDLECLLHPAWKENWRPLSFPLELSGLLPERRLDAGQKPYEDGGVICGGGHRLAGEELVYQVGADGSLEVVRHACFAGTGGNVPRAGGMAVHPAAYMDELVGGFVVAWDFFQKRQTEVAEQLDCFSGLPLRVLLRSTNFYARILQDAVLPENLRHGDSFVQSLKTGLGPLPEHLPAMQSESVARMEMVALQRHDIPYFQTTGNGEDLLAEGVTVPGLFQQGGALAVVRQRLRGLNSSGKERAAKLLRHCFAASAERYHCKEAPGAQVNEGSDTQAVFVLCRRLSIGLREWAWEQNDGCLTWSRGAWPAFPPLERHFLYEGDAGAAIFLAAVGKCLDDQQAMAMAERYQDEMLAELEKASELGRINSLSCGLGNGLGSIILAALCLDRLLGNGKGRAACLSIIRGGHVPPEYPDPTRDLLGGLPGFLSVLSELMGDGGDNHVRELGRGILSTMRARDYVDPEGCWRDGRGALQQGGFAHGGGGIALALARWRRVDPDCGFPLDDWLKGALRPELEFLSRKDQGRMESWCRGSAGLLVCGVGLGEALGETPVFGEMKHLALEQLLRSQGTQMDHLCCGNAGRFAAARIAGLPLSALRRAMLRKRQRDSGFVFDAGPSLPRHGFFRGETGIAYELLQSVSPGVLPDLSMLTSWPARGAGQ